MSYIGGDILDQNIIYTIGKLAGLSDDAAKAAAAIARNESGFNSNNYTPDTNGKGSYGVFQFNGGGQLINFQTYLNKTYGQNYTLQQAGQYAALHSVESAWWALNGINGTGGYLGSALVNGTNKGYTGVDLAVFAQKTGQVGESYLIPANWITLWGAGQQPALVAVPGLTDATIPGGVDAVPDQPSTGEEEIPPGQDPGTGQGGTIELPGGVEIPLPDIQIPGLPNITGDLVKSIQEGFSQVIKAIQQGPADLIARFFTGVMQFFIEFIPVWFKQTVYAAIVGRAPVINPDTGQPTPALELNLLQNIRAWIQAAVVNARNQLFQWGATRGVFIVFGIILIGLGLIGLAMEFTAEHPEAKKLAMGAAML